jgi:environmental stress-induced protein Ves
MAVELIRYSALSVSPWRNGAGRKAEIAAGPGWVLGFAWLDGAAPFSHYPSHDRTITLVSGPGFSLHFPGGAPEIIVSAERRPHRFDGGQEAHCRVAGPCFVFNAMTERPGHTHHVAIAEGPATIDAGFAVILLGKVTTPSGLAGELDTLHLTGDNTLELPAGTTAALIHISPS